MKITAVIPAKKNSIRCPLKNIRNFAHSNLLELKIETLKKTKGIDEIVVSSDDDFVLSLAENLGVKVQKRDSYFASSECPNYIYWKYLAENVGNCENENIMVVNCVSPFVDHKIIEKIIKQYKESNFNDGIVTVLPSKKFTWLSDSKTPVNYSLDRSPNSQNLRETFEITFAASICRRDIIKKTNSIFGSNPIFYQLDKIEGIDIDDYYEFVISDLLYKNRYLKNEDLSRYFKKSKPFFLDCTIREAGFLNKWNFSDEFVFDCYKAVSLSGFDYFEAGFLGNPDPNFGKWFYLQQNSIDKLKEYEGCKISSMISIKKEPVFIPKGLDLIRIQHRMDLNNIDVELNKIKNLYLKCKDFAKEISLNLSSSDQYAENLFDKIIENLCNCNFSYVYLADTYGSLDETSTIDKLYIINKNIEKHKMLSGVGFHPHNNLENALSKSKAAIDFGINLLDSTICGIGKGGGNLSSEFLLLHYNQNLMPILSFVEKHLLKSHPYLRNKILYAILSKFKMSQDDFFKFCNMRIEDAYKIISNYEKH